MELAGADRDVVATAAEAERLELAPLLVLDVLEAYFDGLGIGAGSIAAERIGHGSANATFVLRRGVEQIVLRRPPRPPFQPSTHDVVREARLQLALRPQGVRTPEILDVCEDETLLGVPFYLMAFVDGEPLVETLPPRLDGDPAACARLLEGVVEALVEIHAADVEEPGLAAFRRPGSYSERQVRRFRKLWDANATREIPAVGEVADWLERSLPAPLPDTVIHGDYRLGNILFDRSDPTLAAAVVDWEMGAIGDPRADLGFLVATYSAPGMPPMTLELTPATRATGFPQREEIIARYAELSGRDTADLRWFQTLAIWKTTVLCEAIYRRYLAGEKDAAGLAPSFERRIPEMAADALRIASGTP